MRTAHRTGAALVAAMVFAACGGGGGDGSDGGGGGTTPPPPPPPATPASIAVTASSPDAMASIGDTRTLTAVVRDAAGNALPAATVTWTSDNAAVVTVPGSGATVNATAAGNGSATVTASSGTARATVPLSVAQRFATVGLSPSAVPLAPGATQQIAASARDARGNAIAGVTGFTFTTSSAPTAAVSSTGLVTAIAPGTATISAALTREGVTANGSASITVAVPTGASSTAETVVANDDNRFTPSTVEVAPGGVVTWQFRSIAHNVTFGGTAGAPASIPNSSNVSVSRTFNTAGSFPYECTLHAGMTGTVDVRSGGAFVAALNGANERPNPVTTNGTGFSTFAVNGTTVTYVVTFTGLSGPPIGAHIHGPGNANQTAGVLVDFPTAGAAGTTGVLTGTFTASNIRAATGQQPMSLDSLLTLMRNGNAYVNVHTQLNPGGEIRGQIRTP